MESEAGLVDALNLKKICAQYRVGLWQCPQFLFLIMGAVVIAAILATYVVANKYNEPEIAAIIVLILAAILFSIGYLIVRAFEQVALSAKSKSEFISIMSHQLRSPLSAIKWQINILLSDSKPMPNDIKQYMETVGEQNERMIRSVNDLLEVNRIEDNDLILRPTIFSLLDVTKKVAGEYEKFAASNNVRVEIAPESDPIKINADEARIKHVIEHLMDNAIRYSIKGGVIKISIEKNGESILWKITDQGAGISKEDQKRVFEKFFRATEALRYQTEGSGVGLFIAKSLIKKSGGEIGFSSSPKGSIFWFTLPVKI